MVDNPHWADRGQHAAEFNDVASRTEPDPEIGEHEDPDQEPILGLQGGPPPPGAALGAGQQYAEIDRRIDEEMENFDNNQYNNENRSLTDEFNVSRGRDD
jgi:hypothetical protein